MILRFIQWLIGSWHNHDWEITEETDLYDTSVGFPYLLKGREKKSKCKKCGDVKEEKL